jgi:hypothetical protein
MYFFTFVIISLYYNCPAAWGVGEGLRTPRREKAAYYETLHSASDLVVSCEHCNEPSGSIKCRVLLEKLTVMQLINKYPVFY